MNVKFTAIKENYFQYGGKFYFPVGVNYIPSSHDWRMWSEWDPEEIKRDFRHMKNLGINIVRVFLLWSDFEPEPGKYDERSLREFAVLIDMAKENGLKLIPTLVGDAAGIKWVPIWAVGKSIYSKEIVEGQCALFKEIAKRCMDEVQILAWDLSNEPAYWEEPKRTDDATNWVGSLAQAIREVDENHLVTVGLDQHNVAGGPDEYKITGRTLFEVEPVVPYMDFISIHVYPLLLAPGEGSLDFRGTYFPAYAIKFCQLGKPVLLEEFGLSSGTVPEEEMAKHYEAVMFSSLINGAAGILSWSWIDELRCDRSPYNRRLPMSRYGIVRVDGTEKPAALKMREFAELVGSFSLIRLERSESALVLPTNIYNSEVGRGTFNSFILGKIAGLDSDIISEYEDLSRFKLLILPFFLSHKYIFLDKIRTFIENGGVAFCSLGPGYIPIKSLEDFLEEVLGIKVDPHVQPLEEQETLAVLQDTPPLTKGDAFRYSDIKTIVYHPLIKTAGSVLAVDSRNKPALILNKYGNGCALTSILPIEYCLSNKPRVYEAGDQTYKIYEYLASLAGIKKFAKSQNPYVEVGTLRDKENCVVVVVNHLNRSLSADLEMGKSGLSLQEIYGKKGTLHRSGNKLFHIDLLPLEAKVFKVLQERQR